MAVGDGDLVRGSAIKFLARHGSKADIKLALTFMMTDDGTLGWACLDLLARLGGQDEVSLIGAAIVFPNGVWSDETKDYARKRLAELEKRLANESAKPILKSPVEPMPNK